MEYKVNEDGKKLCLECGDAIEYGRHDKKFCCDACKNRYNNRRVHDFRAEKYRVHSALERNHEVLDKLIKMGLTSMDLPSLERMGYNPMYMTSTSRSRSYDECWCYDIRFRISGRKVYAIERMKGLG